MQEETRWLPMIKFKTKAEMLKAKKYEKFKNIQDEWRKKEIVQLSMEPTNIVRNIEKEMASFLPHRNQFGVYFFR